MEYIAKKYKTFKDAVEFKVNESRYIALFVFSESIKKLLSIDCVNTYLFSMVFSIDFALWKNFFSIACVKIFLFSIFFSIDFARGKSVGFPRIAYRDLLT